jgi:hypothetical protein
VTRTPVVHPFAPQPGFASHAYSDREKSYCGFNAGQRGTRSSSEAIAYLRVFFLSSEPSPNQESASEVAKVREFLFGTGLLP